MERGNPQEEITMNSNLSVITSIVTASMATATIAIIITDNPRALFAFPVFVIILALCVVTVYIVNRIKGEINE